MILSVENHPAYVYIQLFSLEILFPKLKGERVTISIPSKTWRLG